MPDRYSFSGGSSSKPWFRVGNVDVTTTVLITALAAASLLIWALDKSLLAPLSLDVNAVRHGQIWRLVTWPLANTVSIWSVLSIALFWYFGGQIETMLTRDRYAVFLAILTVVPAIAATLVGVDVAGINYLELGLFVVFIAEFPFARFFFNVPGWALGAVFIGIQVLQLVGLRMWPELAFLVVLIATGLILARGYGLASSLPWIPKLPLPLAERSAGKSKKSGAKRGLGLGKSKRNRDGRANSGSGGNVVSGPWTAPPPPATPSSRSTAQAELDHLLDKISAGGLDSLSPDEKRRLNELSKRLR